MSFRAWFAVLALAAAVGYVATVLTAPSGSGNDPFDSPVLLPAIGVLAVLCGLAGWSVPRGGPWWGVVVAVVYLVGVTVRFFLRPAEDGSFAALGVVILLVLLLVPWLAGMVAGIIARRR